MTDVASAIPQADTAQSMASPPPERAFLSEDVILADAAAADRSRKRRIVAFALVSPGVAYGMARYFTWHFPAPALVACVIIVGITFGLSIWTYRKIAEISALYRTIGEKLSPSAIAARQNQLASGHKKPAEVVRDLATASIEIANRGAGPRFIKGFFNRLSQRLLICEQNLDNSARVFGTPETAIPGDVAWRSTAQLLLTALLFAGIIGTFWGLIGVFRPEHFTPLFDALKVNPTGNLLDSLSGLLAQFALAFGASLMAYLSYLFGRYALDLVDDSHDALTFYLSEYVIADIRTLLAVFSVEARIDLREETKAKLEAGAEGIALALEGSKRQNAELRTIGNRLAKTADLFKRAAQQAMASAKSIGEGLEKGRTHWQEAANIWRAETQNFAGEARAFGASVSAFSSTTQEAAQRFEQTAQQVTAVWVAKVEEDAQIVNQAIINITQTWTDENRKMIQAISNEVVGFSSKVESLSDQLSSWLKPVSDTLALIHTTAELIKEAQDNLAGHLNDISREQRESVEKIVAILEARGAALESILRDSAQIVSRLRGDLAGMFDAAGEIRAATVGNGTPQTLLEVLSRLHDTLEHIQVSYNPIPPGH